MRHTNILIQTLNSMFAANLNNCKDERWANSSYALHILYIYYSVPVVVIFRPQVSTKRHANILFPLCIIIVIVIM